MMSAVFSIFVILAAALPEPARAASKSCTVLEVDRYFDGEKLNEGPRFILIQNGLITSIDKTAPKAKECQSISLKGKMVGPGLIDAHTHVLLTDETYGTDFSGELKKQVSLDPTKRRERAESALSSLINSGFTSIRDVGNSGQFGDMALRDALAKAGTPAPRIFGSGPGIAMDVGQFPKGTESAVVAKEYRVVKNAKEAAAIVAEYEKKGVDLIKVYADSDPQPANMPADILDAFVKAAHEKGLKVAAHATEGPSALRAALAGVDSIEHGYVLSEKTLQIMRDKKIALVANDYSSAQCEMIAKHDKDRSFHPCSNYKSDHSRRLLAARDAGVQIVFGSDMYLVLDGEQAKRGPATIDSLVAYVEEGLKSVEAMTAATSSAAQLIGDEKLGVIKAGAKADLVAFAKNPFESFDGIRTVDFVMKAGSIVCQGTQGAGSCTK